MKKFVFCLIVIIPVCVFNSTLNAQAFEWAGGISGSGEARGRSIAVDMSGNVYSAGYFQTPTDFDFTTDTFFINGTVYGMYVCKHDSSGNLLWAKCFNNATAGEIRDIALDNDGACYITGSFDGTVDFDPGPDTTEFFVPPFSTRFAFLVKLDQNGDFVYANKMGGPSGSIDYGRSIDLDTDGNVYTGGSFCDEGDYDPGAPFYSLISAGASDIFLQKLDTAGNFKWAFSLGAGGPEMIGSVDVDVNNYINVAGTFKYTVDFDPGPGVTNLTTPDMEDNMFICRYDTAGNLIFAKHISSLAATFLGDIVTDVNGNIYASGWTMSTVDLDPGAGVFNVTSPADWSAFVLKLDNSGNFVWGKLLGRDSYWDAYEGNWFKRSGMAIDNMSSIYLTGMLMGTGDFDPGPGTFDLTNPSTSVPNIFITKLDETGEFQWAKQIGSTGFDIGMAIAVDDSFNVYSTGSFVNTVDFNPMIDTFNLTAISPGFNDAYVLKLSQDLCSNTDLWIDSVLNLSCTSGGYSSAYYLNAHYPVNYVWNTIPPTNDSIIFLSESGIYQIIATDSLGCSRERHVFVDGPNDTINFDLRAHLITTEFVPGYSTPVFIEVFNEGCDPTSGYVTLIADSIINHFFVSPSPSYYAGDTIRYDFSNITYDSSFTIQLNVTPHYMMVAGDSLDFQLSVSPTAGDADTTNNNMEYVFVLNSSYDPNIKNVYPEGKCLPKYVRNDEPLTYTVCFQNTGTSDAINIFVIDTIDASLDINSIDILRSSHSMITEIIDGNVVKFRFDNIYLPDSSTDEPNSHGYVIFEMSPETLIAEGTVVTNKVGIYFDFNAPVITNTVMNTVTYQDVETINCYLGIPNEEEILVKLFPNPAGSWVNLELNNEISDATIEIVDMQGKLLQKINKLNGSAFTLNVEDLPAGIYFIRLLSSQQVSAMKFIRQ